MPVVVRLLQGFVFDVGIGLGLEGPDPVDLSVHWNGMLMLKKAPVMFGREQGLYA